MKSKYKTPDEGYDKSERLKQQKKYEEQCHTIKNIAENGSYAFALDRALMEDDRYSSFNTIAGAPLATDAIFTLARYYTDAYHNAKEELIHDILYKSYRAYISLGLEPYRDDQLVDNLISKIDQSDEKYGEIIAFAKSKFLEMRQNLTYLINIIRHLPDNHSETLKISKYAFESLLHFTGTKNEQKKNLLLRELIITSFKAQLPEYAFFVEEVFEQETLLRSAKITEKFFSILEKVEKKLNITNPLKVIDDIEVKAVTETPVVKGSSPKNNKIAFFKTDVKDVKAPLDSLPERARTPNGNIFFDC